MPRPDRRCRSHFRPQRTPYLPVRRRMRSVGDYEAQIANAVIAPAGLDTVTCQPVGLVRPPAGADSVTVLAAALLKPPPVATEPAGQEAVAVPVPAWKATVVLDGPVAPCVPWAPVEPCGPA